MKHTYEKLKPWFEEGAKQPLKIEYVLDRQQLWAPDPYNLATELRFTIQVAASQSGADAT